MKLEIKEIRINEWREIGKLLDIIRGNTNGELMLLKTAENRVKIFYTDDDELALIPAFIKERVELEKEPAPTIV